MFSSSPSSDVALTFYAAVLCAALVVLYGFGLGHLHVLNGAEATLLHQATQSTVGQPWFLPAVNLPPTPPLALIVQKLSTHIWGQSLVAARLPFAFMGGLLVVVFYNSLWLLTHNKRYSLIAAMVLGFSAGGVVYARFAYAEGLAFFFMLTSTLLLIANIYAHERSPVRGIVIGLLLGLGFLSAGVQAYVFPFLTAGLLALLKEHGGYNLRTMAPVRTVMFSVLSITPWLVVVYKSGGWPALGAHMQALLTFPFELSPNLKIFGLFGLATLPWGVMLPLALWRITPYFFRNIRGFEPHTGLSAFACVWLVLAGVGAWVGMSGAILWATPPLALLCAYAFEDCLRSPLKGAEKAAYISLWALLGVCVAILPFVPAALQEGVGLKLAQEVFLQGALTTPVEWGYGAFLCGAFLALGGVLSGLVLRYGAAKGVVYIGVCVWAAHMLAVYTILPRYYAYTQQPLVWMAQKIKNYAVVNPVKVFVYKEAFPTLSFVSGQKYTLLEEGEGFSPHSENTVFVLTYKAHMPEVSPALPQNAKKECFGAYCLVEVPPVK